MKTFKERNKYRDKCAKNIKFEIDKTERNIKETQVYEKSIITGNQL